ncbi:MAG: hypothetical protein QOF78_4493 [Phycisphaerales bacterium]|jgi:hypothetical protein|nr:hypothetical protein [Phycisphaerales bacterium]
MFLILAAGTVFTSGPPEGFVTNRTLLIGLVVAVVLAILVKLFFRRSDARDLAQREEASDVAAIKRDGPPTFNG